VRSLLRSPVARFSLISLVVMAALGAALGVTLQGRINQRALDGTARTVKILGEVVETHMTPAELGRGLRPATLRTLANEFGGDELRRSGVDRVKIFDAERVMVYSNDGEGIGRPAPRRSNVAKALAGETVRQIERGTADDGRGELTLSVYSPLRDGSGRPYGAFEIYLDHAPTAAAARDDVRALWLLIVVGFSVLWASLFRLVRSASAALRRQVAENRRQATHDALTGLPNRTLLYDRLQAALDDGAAALLLIDLDRFKEVNDTLGHDHGDRLLCDVATRLREAVEPCDLVARMGGDEFAVLRPGARTEDEGRRLAGRVALALRTPFELGGTTVVVDASIGLAMCPLHGEDVTTLIRLADVAMYEAKARRTEVESYDAARDHHHADRLKLLGELPRALAEGELVLAYQPKLDLASGEVRGAEALVRWQHPVRGLLSPGSFIPAAELTSLVGPLTLYVLDAALRQQREWASAGLDLAVAVNLAGPSVMDVDLPGAVGALLEKHGSDPTALTLEINEGTMMSDVPAALRVLSGLRAHGVQLSLDDFGTGQTSLIQLHQLPLQELKIDRSLVIGDARLVGSIVEMGHRFGLSVVGEGIETKETEEVLRDAGCDAVQGFLYARPLWADELAAWVAERELASAA
jgi:diguanylate cyclase (GGDEF)-like protein